MSETFSVQVPVVDQPVVPVAQVDLSNFQFVEYTDPILRQVMPRFNFSNPPVDPIELAHALVKKMIDSNGIGLSANQVGLPYRVFAMAGEPNFVCYNPTIVGHGNDTARETEGCLSYPNLYVPVKRYKSIKVRFTMPNGETTTKVFAGLTARVFQHEMNHMDNLIPLAQTSKLTLKTAIEKCREKYGINYYLKHLWDETKS